MPTRSRSEHQEAIDCVLNRARSGPYCDIYSAIRPGKPGDAGEDRPRRRANRYGGKTRWRRYASAFRQMTRTRSTKITGYHVRGYLREGDYSWEGAYVYLTFDEYGTITEINYCEGVDVAASLEENLSQAEQDFQTLNAPLNGLNVSVADPELLATSTIPVDFKETFLAGSVLRGCRRIQ